MYDYLKRELERKFLTYAEVNRNVRSDPEDIFVIATDKDYVIEAALGFKEENCVLLNVRINSGDFNSVLRDYMDASLNGVIQEINVHHNENVVQLQ